MGISGYVRGLREKVGTDLLLMPSTHVLVRDDDGRVLLVRHVEGRWMLPGGAIEPGERPEEAAARECLEEAGIVVEPFRLAGVYGGPEFEVTYANGDRTAWVVTIYEGRIVQGEPVPDEDEVDAARWFAREEIDALAQSAATRAILRDLLG